jgi:hypothetical protein
MAANVRICAILLNFRLLELQRGSLIGVPN